MPKETYHNKRDKYGRFAPKNPYKRLGKTPNKKIDLEAYDMFILDESGSMQSICSETMNGFNRVITELASVAKDKKIKNYVSLIKFDYPTDIKSVFTNTPIEDVPKLSTSNYKPRGNTALYDAIAKGIETLKVLTKGKTNVSVSLQIFTDGEENSSIEYSANKNGAAKIKALIEDVRDNHNWTVTFVGAGEDKAIKQYAENIGIYASNTMSYTSDSKGTTNAFATMSTANSMFRASYASTGTVTNDGFFTND